MAAGFLDRQRLRTFLNATTSADEDIDAVGEAACELVVAEVGPVLRTEVTEVAVARSGWAGLRYQPTSITTASAGNPATWTISAFGVHGDMPDGRLTVSYLTGEVVAPRWAIAAAEIIARHLWLTQLGRISGGPGSGQSAPPGAGYTIPNQAAAFLEPHRLGARLG